MGTLTLNTATVSLTSAQILALNATPVQILPAPGVGKFYYVQAALYNYTAGTIPYTDLSVASFGLGVYYDDTDDWNADSMINVNYGLDSSQVVGTGPAGPYGVPQSELSNRPLKLQNNSSTTAGGNGTLTVTVVYAILDV